MKKIEKTKIDKIKRAIKRSPLFIAKHIVQVSLFLLVLSLIIGAIFFYKYNILSVKKELEIIDNSCPLNESNYNKVLEVWERNDLKLEEANFKVYDDIFSREIID
ncbi:hypothetical protein KKA24_00400 [Patescibacteria group bacterium]|nr:hypothetical protein [Patescibacteria group bacterium]